MARRISDKFFNDLLQGELSEIFKICAKVMIHLILEFRGTSIIYLLSRWKIVRNKRNKYGL